MGGTVRTDEENFGGCGKLHGNRMKNTVERTPQSTPGGHETFQTSPETIPAPSCGEQPAAESWKRGTVTVSRIERGMFFSALAFLRLYAIFMTCNPVLSNFNPERELCTKTFCSFRKEQVPKGLDFSPDSRHVTVKSEYFFLNTSFVAVATLRMCEKAVCEKKSYFCTLSSFRDEKCMKRFTA